MSVLNGQTITDTRDFAAEFWEFTDAGNIVATANNGILLWGHGTGNQEACVSYELCTDESSALNCYNSSRLLQVGDAVSFEMKGYQVRGEVGVVFNSSPQFYTGSFQFPHTEYSYKNSNQALELRSAGFGDYWHINHAGSTIETAFQSSSSMQTWDVTVQLTSKTTAVVTLSDGTNTNAYPVTLALPNISHITFYIKDDYNGSTNEDFYFGDDGNKMLFSNSGNLTLTDPNNDLVFGDISNPLEPGSTSSYMNLNLTVDDDITVEGMIDIGGNLTINSSKNLYLNLNGANQYSQLKLGGTITNNGSVVHEQNISSTGHHGISSPMTAGFATTTGNSSALYEYDAVNNGVYVGSYVSNGTASTGSIGRGFFAPVGNAGDFLTAAGEFSVTGTPNTSHDWTLSYVTNNQAGSSDNGWNLIGNPYSATLNWSSVTLGNNVNGAIYVWDPSNSQYMSWTSVGGGVNGGSQYIPPMQAFWVQTTSGGTGTDYDISTTMSSNTVTSQSPTFQKTQNDILKLSIINLSDNTKNDETIIAHSAGSIDGFDGKLDAWKLDNYGGNPNIYSFYAGDRLAINAVDLSIPKVIPMGIDAPQSRDVYQLTLEQIVTGDDYEVILEDKHLNTFTDITQSAYSFQYGGWPNSGPRFNLHISGTNNIGVDEEELMGSYVYQHDNEVFINTNENIHSKYEIWTIDGRLVQEGVISGSITKCAKPQSGLYLIKLLGNDATKAIKTFLK